MRTINAPGIETMIINGLEAQIAKYFGVQKTVFTTTSDRRSRLRILQEVNKDGDMKYPYIFLVLESGSLSSSWNARHLRRHGVYLAEGDSENSIDRSFMVPVNMNFSVELETDSATTVLQFFKKWFLALAANSLNFSIDYDSGAFPISVQLSNDLAVPKRDVQLESPSYYEMAGQLTVQGYVSPNSLEMVPTITQTVVNLDTMNSAGTAAGQPEVVTVLPTA